MAKLSFFGATGNTVTGSSYLLEVEDMQVLIDCGMYQGEREVEQKNRLMFPFDPKKLKYVFLTHAHLDHCGLLPKLFKDGFTGKIIATDATRDLAGIILEDAAKLQEDQGNREAESGDVMSSEPIYTRDDVAATLERFETYPYHEIVKLSENLSFRMREAGHILGSATLEIWFKNQLGRERKVVFSGDLGQTGARIIRDPDFIRESDYIVMESTYGGRNHRDKNATLIELLAILNEASREKSCVVIPSFAVERAQEILYEVNLFIEKKVLKGLAFYLDSPLAIKATEIFRKYRKYYDEDALSLVKTGDDPFSFRGLEYVIDTHQSKRISGERGSVIIAGSGMCTGGRVLHHLINVLPDKRNHVVFVGFQVNGTLGRRLIDGADRVRIYGVEVPVRAQIHTLNGFSAHADQNDLLYWLRSFGHSPHEVFITHGDETNKREFSEKVRNELQLNTIIPESGSSYDLD